jgi:hypothetical protein
VKGVKILDWNVPALSSLPVVWKVQRQAPGIMDAPTVTHPTTRGYQADGTAPCDSSGTTTTGRGNHTLTKVPKKCARTRKLPPWVSSRTPNRGILAV